MPLGSDICLCMSKPASLHIPTTPACQQVLPVEHRLATKEGQPAHMAAASFSHTHSKGGPPSGLSTSHEPVRLTAIGRARAGGFLNGSLPGSAAAAAVVNLYTGHPGTSPASRVKCLRRLQQVVLVALLDSMVACNCARLPCTGCPPLYVGVVEG